MTTTDSPMLDLEQVKELLDEKLDAFNRHDFYVPSDPIQVPHLFGGREDIEVAAFLAAAIAWGQRKTVVANALELARRMDMRPGQFVREASDAELASFADFKHRTFNGQDCVFFLRSLRWIYQRHGGLEEVFSRGFALGRGSFGALAHFREVFLEVDHPPRSRKHVADVRAGSAAKRLNMFLRWMVRRDDRGVDFGLWSRVPMAELSIPLDVHVGRVARALGILSRRQDDWRAVEELDAVLRGFDPSDPCKYDYALFGLGVFEKF